MLYAAKCYWPGITQTELEQVALGRSKLVAACSPDVAYRGSLLFGDDDLVLCLFEGPTRTAVKRASEQAGIPCERVMQSVWLGARPGAEPRGYAMKNRPVRRYAVSTRIRISIALLTSVAVLATTQPPPPPHDAATCARTSRPRHSASR